MIGQRLRILNHTSRANLSSIFVLLYLRKSLLFRGCALGRWLDVCVIDNWYSKRGRHSFTMREDAFVAFVADTLFVERANTIMMRFAGFAFVAFPF